MEPKELQHESQETPTTHTPTAPQNKKNSFHELKDLYLFEELNNFVKGSTGISIFIAYMVLLLSSMSYLFILFNAFDVHIVKYVTLEDVLATPIKNPTIIYSYLAMLFIFYCTDKVNRYRASLEAKYAGKQAPFWVMPLRVIFWAPKKRKANVKLVVQMMVVCLVAYILLFAKSEARYIQKGQGTWVEITLADENEKVSAILLGTTVNYVFTYDHEKKESMIYYVEAIKSIKRIRLEDDETKSENSEDNAPHIQEPDS